MIIRTLHCSKTIVILLVGAVLSLQCLITSEAKTNLGVNRTRALHDVFKRESKLNDHELRVSQHNSSELDLGRASPGPALEVQKHKNEQKVNSTVPPSRVDSLPKLEHIHGITSMGHNETEMLKTFGSYKMNSGALLRAFYVFGGLSAVVMMYILVRTIRLRRKKTTIRKYGILANREDVEMTPLGAEDDEDTTIFELNH